MISKKYVLGQHVTRILWCQKDSAQGVPLIKSRAINYEMPGAGIASSKRFIMKSHLVWCLAANVDKKR